MNTIDLNHECAPARWSLCSSNFLPYAFSEYLSDCALSYAIRMVNSDLKRTERLTGKPIFPVVRLEVHDWDLAEIGAELAAKYGLEVAYVEEDEYA